MRIERSEGEVTHPLIDKDADRRKGEKPAEWSERGNEQERESRGEERREESPEKAR